MQRNDAPEAETVAGEEGCGKNERREEDRHVCSHHQDPKSCLLAICVHLAYLCL